MRFVTDAEVEDILLHDPNDYLDYLVARIGDIRDPKANAFAHLKPKIIYDDPWSKYGDIRPMTCFTELAKVVKIIATNPFREENPCVSVGCTIMLDQAENFPVAIFDAPVMSGVRTAAMVALAIEWIRPNFDSLCIVGSEGRVGRYFTDLITERHERPWKLQMVDKRFDSRLLDNQFAYDEEVVVLATDSREPIIYPDNCAADLVISVGADTHFNREISEEYLMNKVVYADILEAADVGDLEALDQRLGHKLAGDMFAMLTHLEAGQRVKPNVFISVGSALMDALTVEYLGIKLGLIVL